MIHIDLTPFYNWHLVLAIDELQQTILKDQFPQLRDKLLDQIALMKAALRLLNGCRDEEAYRDSFERALTAAIEFVRTNKR